MADPERPPTVLVVDDNEQNRALALATLEAEGYEVVCATNGEEALASFEKAPADCVLLDVRMPGMDGFEVCTRLRALPGGAHTPIVFLTALRDVDTFDHAQSAGGDDFLTKPVRPSELVLRVRAALKIKRLNLENQEFYELIRHQRDDLLRLQLQKERLTAFVVHDLKNPVGTVDLHAQLLLRDKELPKRARDAASAIREEMRALLRLILNLLDISKAEEGRLEPERSELDLERLSSEVFDAFAPRAQASDLKLERELSVTTVWADADLLRRVLENLVDNALRHSPDGGTVRLEATSAEGRVELRVADAGPGVPVGLRERIFDPFVRLERSDRLPSRGGRGLGLTFCRIAVEAHGGKIWVEDGQPGAVLCLSLPHGN